MSKIITYIACILVFIASPIVNSKSNSAIEVDTSNATCFSSHEKGEFIFISLILFADYRLGGYVQHNNGPILRLKYLYANYIDKKGAGNDSESHTYAEITNNKITGYYIYNWYRGDMPILEYYPKKSNRRYGLFIDSEAQTSHTPDIACDWSKSSLLNDTNNQKYK